MRRARSAAGAFIVAALTLLAVQLPAGSAHAAGPRIDLKVLVVTDGGTPVSAIENQLTVEGVPHTTVDLNDPNRPKITAAFLQDSVNGSPRAKYQGVVLPNANPFVDQAEMTALAAFERSFGIRQVDAYVYPSPSVGLNSPGFAGTLDGTTANLTTSGLSGPFRYLKGPVRFEDNSPSVGESYGYLASPLPDDPARGASYVPFLTATADGQTGSMGGVYTHDGGRSELVLTYAYNSGQRQFRLVGHGIISWLTKGLHLGYARSYFSVHVDDVFLPDERWSSDDNCTPGEDCAPGVTTTPIRMTPEDVTAAVNWQTQHNFKFDMYFNGAGSVEAIERNGSDPLTTSLVNNRGRFRWANHTYEHPYLGCRQDVTVVPWRCQTDATGNTLWVSKTTIKDQIARNRTWAAGKGISSPTGELVTGEHSGLKILPQQPVDNPNLASALNETGVRWIGSDASRDKNQRAVGNALTVPRYPMSNYFNVGTRSEMVDEYNWIYTSRANGGSGICEDNPATVTCIQPLDTATGYDAHIIPVDSRITESHILANDPRPHYVHQSNLAEDRILYPMLENILGEYRTAFAANAPLVNDPMADLGAELRRQSAWRAAMNNVTAYVQDGKVTVVPPSGVAVPLTAPQGTRDTSGLLGWLLGEPFGDQYAGERSGYKTTNTTLTLP
ncbi:MAG TPA: hypothetical protein VE465_05965 [Streptosporangiaceae bacterium]|jgi:hypothetical protein|nr:hypothetical protein [Streptosporangiaceae bacterium]